MTKEEAERKRLYAATEWDLHSKMKGRFNETIYVPPKMKNIDRLLIEEAKHRNIKIEVVEEDKAYETLMAIFDNFPKIDSYEVLRNYVFTLDGILEIFFENYFERVEGPSCCCDKASFVIGRIKKALEAKKCLDLQREKEDEYWCPKTIKNTDQAINLFYRTIAFGSRGIIKEE